MIESYESSLVGIPFLQKMCQPICLQESHKELTSNISFNLAFLLCSRFWRITRKAISALCFFSDKCTKWNVTLSPWIWHLSRWVCWPQGQLITPVWIWTSWATVHPLAGPLLPLPQCVVTQLQRKCTHTEFESQAIRIGSPLPQYWYFNWG